MLILETTHYIDVIKEFRGRNNLSQEKFAEKVGYDKSHISHIENGDREPTAEFLIAFSKVSHLSIDYILGVETEAGVQMIVNEQAERIMKLTPADRQFIFEVQDKLISRFEKG